MHDLASELHEVLHRRLARREALRPAHNLHASDVTHPERRFCPREWAIRANVRSRFDRTRLVGAAEAATWGFGKNIEDLVRGWLKGDLWGDWHCPHCGEDLKARTHPDRCPWCGWSKFFDYIERRFVSKRSGISCSIDGFWVQPDQSKVLLEIKSVMKEEFSALIGPYAEHAHRTRLYLRILAEAKKKPKKLRLDQAVVLYVCKGGYTKNVDVLSYAHADKPYSPFKTFVVDRNDGAIEDDYRVGQSAYFASLGQVPMPERICATPSSSRAVICDVCEQCFGKKYPPGVKIKTKS